MAGIGPAIKTTGITGANKPGDASGSKNKVAALSISNITDKEKAIENGQNPDATAEVAKEDKQNTGTTTKKVNADEAAKNATQTPRERLVGHIEEMNKTLQKFQEENNGKIAEAQAFGQQAQQNKAAEDMAKMMAMQQAQQPKQETPKAPTPSQSKPSSNSNNEAVKKLAEQQKEVNAKQQEQMQKLAEALKKEKAKNESPETKLKEAQLALETRKAKEAETDDSKRSGAADKALEASGDKKTASVESLMKLDKLVDEVKAGPRDSNADTKLLARLDELAENSGDKNIGAIRDDFKGFIEKKPSSSVDEATTKAIASRSDLEAYDENSFNLDIKPESRSEDISQDLERDTDQTLNEVQQDTEKEIEESQEEIEEVQQEEADVKAQEELDALLEDININIEE